jgi:DNA-binding NtrC family response regulator
LISPKLHQLGLENSKDAGKSPSRILSLTHDKKEFDMSSRRVLIIDDNIHSREVLGSYLERLGYKTIKLASSPNIYNHIEHCAVDSDLIFLDQRLARYEALTILKWLKGHHLFKATPVILQAHDDGDDIMRAMNVGAFDFIYTPIDERLLMFIAKTALEKDLLDKQGDLF